MCPPDPLGSLIVARRLDVMLDHFQRTPLSDAHAPSVPPVAGQNNARDMRTATQQEGGSTGGNSQSGSGLSGKDGGRVQGDVGGQTAQHIRSKSTDQQKQNDSGQSSSERQTVRIGDLAISVSRGGKALATVLQTLPEFIQNTAKPVPNATNVVASSRGMLQGKAPLVSAAMFTPQGAANIPTLAAHLRDTVTSSGLFYESHLAEWATGARDFSQILREPQALLSRPDVAAMANQVRQQPLPTGTEQVFSRFFEGENTATSSTSLPNFAQSEPDRSGPTPHPARADQVALRTYQAFELGGKVPAHPPPPEFFEQSSASALQKSIKALGIAAFQNQAGPLRQSGVATETTPLLQKQLECLEHPHFAWAGEAWPGVAMEWDIEPGERDNNRRQAPQAWHTQLRVALPVLGGVEIKLNLLNQALVMQVRTTNLDASATLREASHDLRSQLVKAGVQVISLSVNTDTTVATSSEVSS
jgi:hypothetical protein